MNDEQIKEVMRLADDIADYAWKQGLSDGAYSQSDHDRKSCDASRAELETYLRTIGEPENTFPLNPNGASKWAHLQKHDGAEAVGVVFRTGSGSVGSLVDGRVVWADWLAHPNGSKPESVNAELLAIVHQTVGMIENTSIETGCCCCGDGMDGHASPLICGHSATDQGAYLAGLLYEDAKAAIARAESAIESSPKPVSPDLLESARAVVARWDAPTWKDLPATAEYIGRLRVAIAQADLDGALTAEEWVVKNVSGSAGLVSAMVIRAEAEESAIETPAKVSPCAGHAVQLPDPLGLLSCTHPDCGRYEGPRSHECRAMADNACARPSICQGHAVQQEADASRDWPEDFPHENGQYMNTCHVCKNTFIGHKHRVVCKVCKVRNNGFIRAQQEADEAGGA